MICLIVLTFLCIPPLHYVLIVTLKTHFSCCFPNHNLMPNHLDWQFKVHEWEAESETKVATKLSHQVERGMGKNLSWHRLCFAEHEGQSRFWDLGFWNKASLNVHFIAGFVAGVVWKVAILHVLFNNIFTDIVSTDLCVRVPEAKTTLTLTSFWYL